MQERLCVPGTQEHFTLKRFTVSNNSEAQLEFDQGANLWQGENETIFVRMTDNTFHSYVSGYLATRGIIRPTSLQQYMALEYCRHLSYWQDCIDPTVRIIRRR